MFQSYGDNQYLRIFENIYGSVSVFKQLIPILDVFNFKLRPIIAFNMIICGTKGYNLDTGDKIWDYFGKGFLRSILVSKKDISFMYFTGNDYQVIEKDDKKTVKTVGFITRYNFYTKEEKYIAIEDLPQTSLLECSNGYIVQAFKSNKIKAFY